MRYTRRDWIIAGILTLFILILATCAVTTGCTGWGDDFAAYINEGIAIADGRFQEQIELNYEQHPSELTSEAKNDKLVYVWGYPLELALVYKIVGFDRENYTSVIWYKAPIVISLALLCSALYLLFRRRFEYWLSAFLALLFCVNYNFYEVLNRLYCDIPFLFLSFLTLLLMECYADDPENWKVGIGYGFSLWLTYETRLNGIALCAVAVIGHVSRQLYLLYHAHTTQKATLQATDTPFKRKNTIHKDAVKTLMPYMVFGALILITEHLWLASATPNISDVGKATASDIQYHIQYYRMLIMGFFQNLFGMTIMSVGSMLAGACVFGIVVKGFHWKNLHLTLLLAGTLVVVIRLPYIQGLRYIYNILPILLMYAADGVKSVILLLCKAMKKIIGGKMPGAEKRIKTVGMIIIYVVVAEMAFLPTAAQITRDYNNLRNWGEKEEDDVYAQDAIDTYRFIQENIPADAVIAFLKPRALYLNTHRRSFCPDINGHVTSDADYYLYYKIKFKGMTESAEDSVPKRLIMENDAFALYEITA